MTENIENTRNTIEVHITEEQYRNLYSYSTKTDLKKGKVVEYIAKEIFKELGAETIVTIKDKQKQLNLGDYLIFDSKGRRKTVEVKTSHQFNGVDKLAMDYKYFKYYNNQKKELIPYFQRNTFSEFGWLVDNRADLLLAFNPISCKAYLAKDFSKLAENILSEVESYINSLENKEVTWYFNNHKNCINEYLEGSVKQDGELKKALIVNLALSKEAVKHYEGRLVVINVDLYVENMKLEEYKVQSRQGRKDRFIIEIDKSEEKTKASTTGTCRS